MDELKIISNPIRRMILVLIRKEPMTISELHREIKKPKGKNYNYKAIHKQVMILEKNKLIKLKMQKKERGNPIIVKPELKNEEKLSLLKHYLKENIEKIKIKPYAP